MFLSLEISSIPSSIMGCSSLAEFYMGWVQFANSLCTHNIFLKKVYSLVLIVSCLFISLNCRTNLLSSLPAEIGALSRLGTLDLHSNQVNKITYSLQNQFIFLFLLQLELVFFGT